MCSFELFGCADGGVSGEGLTSEFAEVEERVVEVLGRAMRSATVVRAREKVVVLRSD